MSKRNIVNPDHYKVAGRLAPDDLARARRTQHEALFGETKGRKKQKPLPPWLAHPPQTQASDEDDAASFAQEVRAKAGEPSPKKPQSASSRGSSAGRSASAGRGATRKTAGKRTAKSAAKTAAKRAAKKSGAAKKGASARAGSAAKSKAARKTSNAGRGARKSSKSAKKR